MRDFIRIHPKDAAVIHVGDLKHRVHPWISRSSFTEDDLPHPPIVIMLLWNLPFCLDDHPVTSSDD